MKIVDTHQHLWDLNRQKYSWCAGVPALNKSFVMSDYLAAVRALPEGITIEKSVHVEADVDDAYLEAETRWLLELAARADNPLSGLVIGCRPEADEFVPYLEEWSGNPLVKGIRRVLHTQPDELIINSCFIERLRRLSSHDLTFDLCVLPRQLPNAIEMVTKLPNVRFVFDHCGIPDVKNRALDPWREHVKQLSKLDNVVACKISGLVAYADATNWKPDDLKPFVDHAIESFGWDRVMFGSDWPVCTLTTSMATWVKTLIELVSDASDVEKDKLFAANATRVYKL